jgi:hypothetical protein
LSQLEKKNKEIIKEYAQKWRDLAAQVYPPFLDKEMVTLFVNTFMASYYEHMMGGSTQQFIDVVAIIECIEQGIRSSKIFTSTKKRALERRRKILIISKVVTEVKKTNSKTITSHPLHPKLLTSTLTLHFLPKKSKTQDILISPHNFLIDFLIS